MFLALRAVSATVWSFVDPLARGLGLIDYIVIALAYVKAAASSQYSFGQRPGDVADAIAYLERPFLDFAWCVAQLALPMGWIGMRGSVVADTSIPSREPGRRIPVRIAKPTASERPILILWMHGGGLCLGNATGEAVLYRFFATRLAATVVSVGYRMVPEHRWPACIDDCEDVALSLVADPAYRNH